MIDRPSRDADSEAKICCADFYASDTVKWLLGDSFHPGGLPLTARLGELLELGINDVVLDVASGTGASAIALAERFGCRVVGVDYSQANVEAATAVAVASPAADRVLFITGDAESLPFESESFDALVCECSFCTFPDQPAASNEFRRVLRPEGRIGLSDLNLHCALPSELENVFGLIICVAGARSSATYGEILHKAGLNVESVERHDEELLQLIDDVRLKLLGAAVFTKVQRIAIPDIDIDRALSTARWAANAVNNGDLGYSILIGRK
jgi:arsenite methyltransferase